MSLHLEDSVIKQFRIRGMTDFVLSTLINELLNDWLLTHKWNSDTADLVMRRMKVDSLTWLRFKKLKLKSGLSWPDFMRYVANKID